jgi:DNA-binding transcriptional ArsR family regulator
VNFVNGGGYTADDGGAIYNEGGANIRIQRHHPSATNGSAVAELLGTVRARLLDMLRSPATTNALARQLGVTPSAVSQHLAALHRGGLIDRQRSGRSVLYTTTGLGLALLGG